VQQKAAGKGGRACRELPQARLYVWLVYYSPITVIK
jgi:hypothetical protein